MQFAPSIVAKLRAQAARQAELTEMLSSPEIVADTRRLPALLQERGALEQLAGLATRLDALLLRRREAESILAQSGPDAEFAALAREELELLETQERAFDAELKDALVSDKEDRRSKVIVEIRAGVGGDEATLFARELYGIYRKYFEARRWKVEEFGVSTSEVGGFKDVVFAVEGEGAWSRLRFESGGHRVQRVPATEAQGRIHTSAATVAVLPEAEDLEIELRPDDLRIETMRAGGAGGQHVNKTESAVRITHVPTGLVAACQDDRSQQRNRASALRMLKARVYEKERARLAAERSAERKSQVGTGDRSDRIRTYNWPQNRVTDHRLNQNFSLEQVLSGKLDPLLDGLVARDREERIKNLA
jgi:peptide chain release factor 1